MAILGAVAIVAGSLQLAWSYTGEEARLALVQLTEPERPPLTVSFHPAPSRVAIRMAFPPTNRTIDVSGQPAVLPTTLSASAGADQAITVVGEWVATLALAVGAWAPTAVAGPEALTALLGSVAFPMLSAAYRLGLAPAVSVPTWAAPPLRHPTARAAAAAAFGPRATRPVVAAFAASLTSGHQVSLLPLGLGLAGAAVLEPDQLARLLRVQPNPPDTPPTLEQMRAVQAMVVQLGARRAEKVLVDGGAQPVRLWETASMFAQVGGRIRGSPAGRLDDLYTQCFSYMAHPPRPRPAPSALCPDPPARQPQFRREPAHGQPDERFRRTALNAPVVGAVVSPAAALRFPPDVRAQDQAAVAGMRIVLPRTAAELRTWGSLLSNCIGNYTASAATGASLLIGVEKSDRLAYCLELSQDRIVRQFLGRRNRPVPPATAAQVIGHLARSGVVDGTRPANRRWLRTGTG